MKKIILSLIVLSLVQYSFGQGDQNSQESETYVDYRNSNELRTLSKPGTAHGGYGAIHFGYGLIDDRGAFISGVRAGWVINHSFTLGFAFTGYFNDLDNNIDSRISLAGGYAGLLMEPIIFPRSPVHVSFPIIAGIGGAASLREDPFPFDEPWGDYDYISSDIYFVLEPGVNLELSVARFMRLGLGVSYRYTENFDLEGVNENALNNFSGNLMLKFGKF